LSFDFTVFRSGCKFAARLKCVHVIPVNFQISKFNNVTCAFNDRMTRVKGKVVSLNSSATLTAAIKAIIAICVS
jgi:hypothetical protein